MTQTSIAAQDMTADDTAYAYDMINQGKCYTCGTTYHECGRGEGSRFASPNLPLVIMGVDCAVKYEEQGVKGIRRLDNFAPDPAWSGVGMD